jgi:hypothetical protein
MLNRDSILNADDLKTVEVKVPEWGGVLKIRTMTGIDRSAYFKSLQDNKDEKKTVMAALVVACAVDDEGNHVFKSEDVADLSKKSSIPLNRLFEKAAELNALTQKSVDDIAGE